MRHPEPNSPISRTPGPIPRGMGYYHYRVDCNGMGATNCCTLLTGPILDSQGEARARILNGTLEYKGCDQELIVSSQTAVRTNRYGKRQKY